MTTGIVGIGLFAFIFVFLAYRVNELKKKETLAKKEEEKQKQEAVKQRKEANSLKGIAEEKTEEAKTQRDIADKQKGIAEALRGMLNHELSNDFGYLQDIVIIDAEKLKDDPEEIKDFGILQRKIASLVEYYDLVSQKDLDKITPLTYFEQVATTMYDKYRTREVDIKNITIDLGTNFKNKKDRNELRILGRIVGELYQNTFKHAFTSSEITNPRIELEIKKNSKGHITIHYRDNGLGFAENFTQKDTSLGLEYFREITANYEGKLEFGNNSDGGAFVKMFFDKMFIKKS